jgi:hypothetical protein
MHRTLLHNQLLAQDRQQPLLLLQPRQQPVLQQVQQLLVHLQEQQLRQQHRLLHLLQVLRCLRLTLALAHHLLLLVQDLLGFQQLLHRQAQPVPLHHNLLLLHPRPRLQHLLALLVFMQATLLPVQT